MTAVAVARAPLFPRRTSCISITTMITHAGTRTWHAVVVVGDRSSSSTTSPTSKTRCRQDFVLNVTRRKLLLLALPVQQD